MPTRELITSIVALRGFINEIQLEVMGDNCRREEKEFFIGKFHELATTVDTMPKTYETDGQGKEAVAHLHYFTSGWDWYITEKDKEDEQHQAFGWVTTPHGNELGYISIVELMSVGAELDLYFTPAKLKDLTVD
jgi:hypothetical protein